MSDSSPPSRLPYSEFKRYWRIVGFAGLLGTVYGTCVAGAPRTRFLVELRASPLVFGLITSFGSLAILFQIFGADWANRMRRRKPFWIVSAILYRVLFLLVLAAPGLPLSQQGRMLWIVAVLFVTDALRNFGEPMWFSWMTDLTPRESLNREWAARQKFITGIAMFAQAAIAVGFDRFEQRGQVILGFTLLAATGVALGVVDIFCFLVVPEPEPARAPDVPLWKALLEPLRDPEFRPFLAFRAYWNFAINVAAPFMFPYLLTELHFSVFTLQMLMIASSIGTVAASRLWGMLCDTYGQTPAMQALAFAKPIVPLCFLIIPPAKSIAIPAFTLLFLIDGVVNAGINVAFSGTMLKRTPRRNRSMYIGASNFFAVGLAAGVSPLIAGPLIDPLTKVCSFDLGMYHFSGYHVAFLASFLMRFSAGPISRILREEQSHSLSGMAASLRQASPFQVMRHANRLRRAGDEMKRAGAAWSLGRLKSPMAIHDLIFALEDESAAVRAAAADSLGHIGLADAAEPLARVLRDPAASVQSRAARALGLIGGLDSLRALLANMNRMDPQAMGELLESLERIGDEAAILPLICMLQEADSDGLRERIAAALREIAKTDSVDQVVQLLGQQPMDGAPRGPESASVKGEAPLKFRQME
ncbi:MAG: MFS transporter [Candidatus Sumerlaeota bacterium]|nr:MFS transporter [Candidatus Sumerlaeota bacterium]